MFVGADRTTHPLVALELPVVQTASKKDAAPKCSCDQRLGDQGARAPNGGRDFALSTPKASLRRSPAYAGAHERVRARHRRAADWATITNVKQAIRSAGETPYPMRPAPKRCARPESDIVP